MNKYILLYRSGDTYKKNFTGQEQEEISKQWHDWVSSLGPAYIDNSPIIKGGLLVSGNGVEDVEINENMVNGYILLQANKIDEVVKMCNQCPLLQLGKLFEIRELPGD